VILHGYYDYIYIFDDDDGKDDAVFVVWMEYVDEELGVESFKSDRDGRGKVTVYIIKRSFVIHHNTHHSRAQCLQ